LLQRSSVVIVVIVMVVMLALDPDGARVICIVIMVSFNDASFAMMVVTVGADTAGAHVDVLGHGCGRCEQQDRGKTSEDELLRHRCLQSRSA
jgi:hypothetical protein